MQANIKRTSIHSVSAQSGAEFVVRAGWQVAARYGTVESEVAAVRRRVGLADVSANGKVLVEGGQAGAVAQTALGAYAGGLAVNAGVRFDGAYAYALRPDLYFVSAPPGDEVAVGGRLHAASEGHGLVTVTDITHGRAEILVLGPHSGELLSLLCGLDLHDSQFPDNTAKQTSVAKTACIVIRRDLGGLRAYHLIGARSYGAYLWETILDAGQHLGIAPVGFAALDELRRLMDRG